jgi:glycosyltransferase involved in cell wall biosynthesis
MKILMLAPHPFYTPRGTPIAVRYLLESLSSMGHRVDVLSYAEGEDVTDLPGVRHFRSKQPPGVKDVPIGASWQKAVCDLFFLPKARKMMKQARREGEPYEVIHAIEEASFMAGLLKKEFKTPFVFDMDSLMSAQLLEKNAKLKPVSWLFEKLERWSIRESAGVLAVCEALADVARHYDPQVNVSLLPDIPNTGTDPGNLPEMLIDAQGPPDGVRFMYVGNLETYQGIDLMLDAFATVNLDTIRTTLLIVGGSEADRNHYSEKARELVVSGRVRFVGQIPIGQLGRVMEYADVMVSPRIKGINTPMKVYSYLQSGKPMLATRLQTHTQAVGDDAAVLVEPTPEAMGRAMRELAESAELRERIGNAGQAHVEKHYSKQAFDTRLKQFYQGLEIAPAQPNAIASNA